MYKNQPFITNLIVKSSEKGFVDIIGLVLGIIKYFGTYNISWTFLGHLVVKLLYTLSHRTNVTLNTHYNT